MSKHLLICICHFSSFIFFIGRGNVGWIYSSTC